MKKLFLALLLVALAAPPAQAATQKRTVVYYQTQYSNGATGTYVSPKPLLDRNTGVTDVLVAAIHLNDNKIVHLNDHPPSHSRYTQMWQDLAAMQARGVNVIGMVGGAAPGSFTGSTPSSTPTTRCCATRSAPTSSTASTSTSRSACRSAASGA